MGPHDFDPEAVFAAFGARFGVLTAPFSRHRRVGEFFSDSSALPPGVAPSPVRTTYPVHVAIRHDLPAGGCVDIVTHRRSALGTSLTEHMWWSLVTLRLQTQGLPHATDRDVWAHAVAFRPQPPVQADCPVTLDGAALHWSFMVDEDLAVCGAESGGQTLLAAVCPVQLLGQLTIEMVPAA
jgi:hypothetical protein